MKCAPNHFKLPDGKPENKNMSFVRLPNPPSKNVQTLLLAVMAQPQLTKTSPYQHISDLYSS